jgi:hypothetical protein
MEAALLRDITTCWRFFPSSKVKRLLPLDWKRYRFLTWCQLLWYSRGKGKSGGLTWDTG